MFYGLFSDVEDVCKEFQIDHVDGVIVFAAYEYEDYSGDADVIFVNEGKFYHVSAGHCSCYGLEGQWEPEEMPIEALRHVVTKGSGQLREHRDGLCSILDVVEELNIEGAKPETVQLALKLAYG